MLKFFMRLIHCTQKLLKELGTEITGNAPIADDTGLGNWYANLLRIERRKCILFTNEKTMYSFLVPNVLKKDMIDFRAFFTANLCVNLQYEGFDLKVIHSINQEYSEIGLAKTMNRSVLGSMTEMAFGFKFHIEGYEGLERTDILRLNQRINKTPMKCIEYRYPIEALEHAFGNPSRRLPLPESPDDWIMEIARAYCDALDAVQGDEKDIHNRAPQICLKFRGVPATADNVGRATGFAKISHLHNKQRHPILNTPHVAFALYYLASHLGLGLLEAYYVDNLMNYVEREAERLGGIIAYKRK